MVATRSAFESAMFFVSWKSIKTIYDLMAGIKWTVWSRVSHPFRATAEKSRSFGCVPFGHFAQDDNLWHESLELAGMTNLNELVFPEKIEVYAGTS